MTYFTATERELIRLPWLALRPVCWAGVPPARDSPLTIRRAIQLDLRFSSRNVFCASFSITGVHTYQAPPPKNEALVRIREFTRNTLEAHPHIHTLYFQALCGSVEDSSRLRPVWAILTEEFARRRIPWTLRDEADVLFAMGSDSLPLAWARRVWAEPRINVFAERLEQEARRHATLCSVHPAQTEIVGELLLRNRRTVRHWAAAGALLGFIGALNPQEAHAIRNRLLPRHWAKVAGEEKRGRKKRKRK